MRLKLHITGLVQGVGFRPFVSRLAEGQGLKGYVLNDTAGVLIEVEGDRQKIREFLSRLEKEKPSLSKIYSMQYAWLEDAGHGHFEIRKSDGTGDKATSILPDIALCSECLMDILNPKNRRFLYPFTNCTNCGPRFTIIKSLPYDRGNTSMADFTMCTACGREYNLPSDRRYHAQPNACPACGPSIALHDRTGNLICVGEEALEKTVNLIRKGNVVALKGLGGYHLLCDAASPDAVETLRSRKQRYEKPMAVMFPDISSVRDEADISSMEEQAITSVERPIVIVRKKASSSIAGTVSPDSNTLGLFLPYTPLHHLLLRKLKKPVVATSANLTDEPIVKDEKDAFARLKDIADYLLTHNRDIVRRCDDSVVRIIAERQVPLRRSRGFAPLPVIVPFRFAAPVLALGASMNSTIALGIENKVYLSQHIGDLDTLRATEYYEETVSDFLRLFDVRPVRVVADMHPGYFSTRFGERRFSGSLVTVQHHHAHLLSCMIENDMPENARVIGYAFDGMGYGTDRTLWGSEVMIASYREAQRRFHLRPFRLPGGDRAVQEPARTALSLLHETLGDRAVQSGISPFTRDEYAFYLKMIRDDINSPLTSGMGRLFDAAASLIGLRHRVSYQAQAAMELEQRAFLSDDRGSYPFILDGGVIDQRPMVEAIISDIGSGVTRETVARRFHNTIVRIIIDTARLLREETGIAHVALSGGVFQNALLLEGAVTGLREQGFTPLIHQLVPPNDGGVALGQAVYGAERV
ncbi:MAG: carbamoyltransferase HypF [Nitrospiraceae bacterium]|nr:MAG: carbamoyltransferase HypF [Nitrospiraceae bacterium]